MDDTSNTFQNGQQTNLLTEKEFAPALIRVDLSFFARKDTPKGDELDLLLDAIVKYEKMHFPFDNEEDNT